MTALLISLTFPSRQSEIDRHDEILKDIEEAQNAFSASIQSRRSGSQFKKSSGIYGSPEADDFKPFVNPMDEIGSPDKEKEV